MGTLIAIGLILLSAWVVYRSVRSFRARSARRGWWALLALLLVAGASLGVWLAFFFEYQPSHRMRVMSFPLPIAFFVWEEDRWTDFVTPDYYVYPALAANVCTTIGACIAPLLAVFAFLHRRGRDERHDFPV
jgi:amino acid transporter